MTPIDILIKSGLDPKGFQDAKKFSDELSAAVKTGFGINVGEKIAQGIEKIPDALKEAFAEGIRFNAAIQDQVSVFTTLSGSVADARARVQELVEFSEKNPIFKFQDVAESARVLQTLTDGALSTEKGLQGIGDVAAASQHSITEMSEVIGRLYAGLQNGLPVERSTMALLRMGLISGEQARNLNDLAQSGDAIGNAMAYIEPIFKKSAGAMATQTETFNGQIAALKKNIESLASSSVKGAFDAIVVGLEELNQIISSETFKNGIQKLTDLFMNHTMIGQALQAGSALGTASVGGQPGAGEAIGALIGGDVAKLLSGEAKTPAAPKEMPLTDAQKQMAADVEKSLTETKASGLSDREKLEQEYWQRVMEVETTFGSNHAAMQEQLAKVDEDFDRKRVVLRANTDDEAEKNTRESLDRVDAYRKEIQQREVQLDMDALRLQREQFTLQRAILDADFAHPDFEKRAERVTLLQKEIDALDQLIKKLTAAREAETDLAAKQSINQQILGLQSEKTGLETQKIGLTNSPNPSSFEDQWTNAITKIREEWGTTAQQMGQDIQTFVNSAISDTSSELARAIVVTGDFHAALMQIAETILTDIVQAIIRMALQWAISHLLMQTVAKASQAATAAAMVPVAAALAATWAIPATLATIATEGEAADQAPLFIEAAEGMTLGLSAFKAGDYTGDGDPNQVAGLAHKGEFYFTAPQTRAIGVSNLRALASSAGGGIAGALAAAGGGGAKAAPANVHVAVLNGQEELRSFLESADGQKAIFDAVSRRKMDLGINT